MKQLIEHRSAKAHSIAQRLVDDQRGAGLVEYIMLAGLIALACIVAFQGFSKQVQDKVTEQGAKVQGIK